MTHSLASHPSIQEALFAHGVAAIRHAKGGALEDYTSAQLALLATVEAEIKKECADEVAKLQAAVENHRELLADLVNQFAYRVSEDQTAPGYWWFHDGGLSTLEDAIPALVSCGWMRRVESRPDKDWYEFVPPEARDADTRGRDQ